VINELKNGKCSKNVGLVSPLVSKQINFKRQKSLITIECDAHWSILEKPLRTEKNKNTTVVVLYNFVG
jgi:hypothetical protein